MPPAPMKNRKHRKVKFAPKPERRKKKLKRTWSKQAEVSSCCPGAKAAYRGFNAPRARFMNNCRTCAGMRRVLEGGRAIRCPDCNA
jgi:hypothetical protein